MQLLHQQHGLFLGMSQWKITNNPVPKSPKLEICTHSMFQEMSWAQMSFIIQTEQTYFSVFTIPNIHTCSTYETLQEKAS